MAWSKPGMVKTVPFQVVLFVLLPKNIAHTGLGNRARCAGPYRRYLGATSPNFTCARHFIKTGKRTNTHRIGAAAAGRTASAGTPRPSTFKCLHCPALTGEKFPLPITYLPYRRRRLRCWRRHRHRHRCQAAHRHLHHHRRYQYRCRRWL